MRYFLLLLFTVSSVAFCPAGDVQLARAPASVAHNAELDHFTVAYAKEHGLEILRKGPVTVVYYDSPAEMAKALGYPLIYGDGLMVVARVELATGKIHLGRRDNQEDFYYELGKYRFWPADWPKDEKRLRALALDFARKAVARE